MDVLTDVLESIHVRSLVAGRFEFTAPWGLRMTRGVPGFYVVTRGMFWLEVEGLGDPIQLAGGDFVVLPKGQAHVIRDSRRTAALPCEDVLQVVRQSQGLPARRRLPIRRRRRRDDDRRRRASASTTRRAIR